MQTTLDYHVADRRASRGFVVWGVVFVLAGGLFGLAGLAMFAADSMFLAGRSGTRLRTLLPVAVVLGTGATLLVLGVASIRRRRWMRPVAVLTAAGVVSLGGVQVASTLARLPRLLGYYAYPRPGRYSGGPPVGFLVATVAVPLALSVGFLVALPWFAFRFYARPATAAELADLDPVPAWTERWPTPVLGWAVVAAFAGLVAILDALDEAVPAGVVVLTGSTAGTVQAVAAGLLLWSAWLTLRRQRFGVVLSVLVITVGQGAAVVAQATGATAARSRYPPQARYTPAGLTAYAYFGYADWPAAAVTAFGAAVLVGWGVAAYRALCRPRVTEPVPVLPVEPVNPTSPPPAAV